MIDIMRTPTGGLSIAYSYSLIDIISDEDVNNIQTFHDVFTTACQTICMESSKIKYRDNLDYHHLTQQFNLYLVYTLDVDDFDQAQMKLMGIDNLFKEVDTAFHGLIDEITSTAILERNYII